MYINIRFAICENLIANYTYDRKYHTNSIQTFFIGVVWNVVWNSVTHDCSGSSLAQTKSYIIRKNSPIPKVNRKPAYMH